MMQKGKNMKNFDISERIAYYRKLNSMTQAELASRLSVSTQAVSKWEQKISSPDIAILPELSEIFNISIDELFGMKINIEPVFNLVNNVPWEDDRKVRIAFFHGQKLLQQSAYNLQNGLNEINIHFDYGDIYKIHGICKLNL